ncbi:PD-(D/E)XK nuclease domain-containing protein [Actinokineospora sp. NPDC004072]
MQHILHSIAVLYFEEVEPEEPTPKMAGGSSRLDFLLRGCLTWGVSCSR